MNWTARTSSLLTALLPILWATCLHAHSLEKGLVVSDPMTLRLLENRYGFRSFIKPRMDPARPCPPSPDGRGVNNLFEHMPLCEVAVVLKKRIDNAKDASLDSVAQKKAFVGMRFPVDFFHDNDATLELVGIVNRMDRAYRPFRHKGETRADGCGEIRFIYRFGYRETRDGKPLESRLPLTLNLVMRARRTKQPENCAAIAKRWIDFGERQPAEHVTDIADAKALADALVEGPLSLISADHIDRIELNMQIMRLPASVKEDFGTHAEYLLTVFNWNTTNKAFELTPLENQIDPDLNEARSTNPQRFRDKLKAFKALIFSDATLFDIDRGQLVLPHEYLTKTAISVAPGGESRSQNGPVNALMGTEEDCKDPAKRADFLCMDEIEAALKRYERKRVALRTIKSVKGFLARLNDSSCTGCHQARAIAGFHFTGSDHADTFSPNAVFVPGSPHFFADLPRRKRVLQSIGAGTPLNRIDFSRAFSGRADARFAAALAGTALLNGWGAACHVDAGTQKADKSFADWTCGHNLKCTPYMTSARDPQRGICVGQEISQIGDPLETGDVVTKRFGDDFYERREPNGARAYRGQNTSVGLVNGQTLAQRLSLPPGPPVSAFRAAQQPAFTDLGTGGFPGGMLRTQCCEKLPGHATCGMVAVTGFNKCLGESPFTKCFTDNVNYAGLRACDAATPCREDYICLRPILKQTAIRQSFSELPRKSQDYACNPSNSDDQWVKNAKMGTCIPPYFVLQFRVDKHTATFVPEIMPTQ